MANNEISSKDGLPFPQVFQGFSSEVLQWRVNFEPTADGAAIHAWIDRVGDKDRVQQGVAPAFFRDEADLKAFISQFGPYVRSVERIGLVQK